MIQLVINEFLKYFSNKRDNRDGVVVVEPRSTFLPFLKIGDTFALFQSCGNMPVDSDCLNMAVREDARMSPPILRSFYGMLSRATAVISEDVLLAVPFENDSTYLVFTHSIGICCSFKRRTTYSH